MVVQSLPELPVFDFASEMPDSVIVLARRTHFETEHVIQVCRLSRAIYRQLAPLHGLPYEEDERLLLTGAFLHDIGWIEGGTDHEKTAQRLILEASLPPLTQREKTMVACIARYHRKALPYRTHIPFTLLPNSDAVQVCWLAAMLRIADGLDRTHQQLVQRLAVVWDDTALRFHCQVRGDADAECRKAERKGDLLNELLDLKIVIDWSTGL